MLHTELIARSTRTACERHAAARPGEGCDIGISTRSVTYSPLAAGPLPSRQEDLKPKMGVARATRSLSSFLTASTG